MMLAAAPRAKTGSLATTITRPNIATDSIAAISTDFMSNGPLRLDLATDLRGHDQEHHE
jgi:hypothetical protein